MIQPFRAKAFLLFAVLCLMGTLSAQDPAEATKPPLLPPAAAPAVQTADEATSEALALLTQEETPLEKRMERARDITERFPENAPGWAVLGELRMAAGSDEAALVAFKRAVERDATLQSSWHWIGILSKREKRDLPGALQAFQKSIELGGPKAIELNEVAVTQVQLGQMKEAHDTWIEALKLDRDWGVLHANALKAAINLGREEEARGHFEQGLMAQRFADQTVLIWADYLLKKDRRADALAAYERGLDRDPDAARIRYYYAATLLDAGKKDEAIAHMHKAADSAKKNGDTSTETVARKNLFALEHPRDLKKLMEAEKAVTEAPMDLEKNKKSLEKAVKSLDGLNASYPDIWEVLLLRGMAKRYLGDATAARFDFEKVLESVPTQANAMINLALIYRDQKNYYKSVLFAHQAADAAPRDPAILANAGFVLLDSDRCDEARSMLARAQAALPEDVQGEPLQPLVDEIETRCK